MCEICSDSSTSDSWYIICCFSLFILSAGLSTFQTFVKESTFYLTYCSLVFYFIDFSFLLFSSVYFIVCSSFFFLVRVLFLRLFTLSVQVFKAVTFLLSSAWLLWYTVVSLSFETCSTLFLYFFHDPWVIKECVV